jgi:hypothetical protein
MSAEILFKCLSVYEKGNAMFQRLITFLLASLLLVGLPPGVTAQDDDPAVLTDNAGILGEYQVVIPDSWFLHEDLKLISNSQDLLNGIADAKENETDEPQPQHGEVLIDITSLGIAFLTNNLGFELGVDSTANDLARFFFDMRQENDEENDVKVGEVFTDTFGEVEVAGFHSSSKSEGSYRLLIFFKLDSNVFALATIKTAIDDDYPQYADAVKTIIASTQYEPAVAHGIAEPRPGLWVGSYGTESVSFVIGDDYKITDLSVTYSGVNNTCRLDGATANLIDGVMSLNDSQSLFGDSGETATNLALVGRFDTATTVTGVADYTIGCGAFRLVGAQTFSASWQGSGE